MVRIIISAAVTRSIIARSSGVGSARGAPAVRGAGIRQIWRRQGHSRDRVVVCRSFGGHGDGKGLGMRSIAGGVARNMGGHCASRGDGMNGNGYGQGQGQVKGIG